MCKKSLIEFENLMKEWDFSKNEKNPSEISTGSHKRFWWKCKLGEDHEWLAEVRERVKGSKCPYCVGKKVSVTNSLATIKPEVAKEWHPTKNNEKTPNDFLAFSGKKAWWLCKVNQTHEWEATIQSRSNGVGCPCCSGRKVTQEENLEKQFPLIAKYWHPTKNGDLKPKDIKSKTNRKVWWRCTENHEHEWEYAVEKFVSRKTLCIKCEEKKENPYIKLTKEEKEKLKEHWHPKKNKTIHMSATENTNDKKYWWKCDFDENHEWESTVKQKLNKPHCPTCKQKKDYEKIEEEFGHLITEWDEEKNGQKMAEVSLFTTEKMHWKCSKNKEHVWEATINNRVYGTGCPYCSGSLVTEEENFEKQVPHLVEEWHPMKNGDLKPSDVAKNSSKKIWWQCKEDNTHQWEATVHKRTSGRGCPYCSSQMPSETNNLLYVDEELSKEWHPTKNKDLTPKDVTPNSGKRVWWQCPKHPKHEWRATTASRRQGSGCPTCNSKGTSKPEYEMMYFLKENDIEVVHRHKTEYGEVDLFLPNYEVAIEYNGEYYHKNRRKKDEEKFKKIKEKYKLIIVNEGGLKGYEDINREGQHIIQLYNKLPREQDFEYIKKIFELLKIESKIEIHKKENNNVLKLMEKTEIENSIEKIEILKKEWHYEKNKGLSPKYFSRGSNESVWWKCSKNEEHEWKTKISSRGVRGSGCPYCVGKKVDKTNNFKKLKPLLAREWHPKKNETIKPHEVTAGSSKKVWWKCRKNHQHEWAAKISARVQGTGCPHCYKEKRRNKEKAN